MRTLSENLQLLVDNKQAMKAVLEKKGKAPSDNQSEYPALVEELDNEAQVSYVLETADGESQAAAQLSSEEKTATGKTKKIIVHGGLGTANPSTVLKGITFTSDTGIKQTGEADGNSSDPVLQEKTVTENGDVTADEGYDGLSKVIVNVDAEPNLQIQMHDVTENNTMLHVIPDEGYDGLSDVVVNVNVPEATTEEKTVTPTKETQEVVPTDAEFLSRVTVNPIPDEYIVVNGVVEITTNNTRVDVRNAAYADVAVPTDLTEIDYYDGSYEVS